MLSSRILLILIATYYGVMSIPHLEKRSLGELNHVNTQTIKHEIQKMVPIVPIHIGIETVKTETKKGRNLPISIYDRNYPHQLYVSNLHFPVHINQYVPVHDLTVIPLHAVHKNSNIAFKVSERSNGDDESVNNYRNPLGGYGAGWFYGGHGAGHGFHYAYGW
ncbi:unnamed protein product [Parnassius apollo]|uniref:(apollo) hypothetical protein n=1 Tax=Parnassius apollo TaxID=110799 RepID=A0A8S3VZ76_PARAO|nr:unnamed protein product [Parnassius apollo]